MLHGQIHGLLACMCKSQQRLSQARVRHKGGIQSCFNRGECQVEEPHQTAVSKAISREEDQDPESTKHCEKRTVGGLVGAQAQPAQHAHDHGAVHLQRADRQQKKMVRDRSATAHCKSADVRGFIQARVTPGKRATAGSTQRIMGVIMEARIKSFHRQPVMETSSQKANLDVLDQQHRRRRDSACGGRSGRGR